MASAFGSNKTKIAKRVIEIFEFFDNGRDEATVMDIVRCYGRPQSSTSELLASLVDMGLLYKDPRSRTYRPTPRLATLGATAQPAIVRDGRLFDFMDRLARSSRHGVALFGQVGIHVQVFRWAGGQQEAAPAGAIGSGSAERLSASTAGQLLLSTLPGEEAGRILRRLNAESAEDERFSYPAMMERVTLWKRQGHASGEAGFAPDLRVTAALLPPGVHERPLAVGVLYPASASIDTDALVATLRNGIDQCAVDQRFDMPVAAPALMRAV